MMGCDIDDGLKKGPWTQEEDEKLVNHIQKYGHGSWRALPKLAGLNRCGKSCRLRWTNYLRPDIKRGNFSQEEEQIIIHLHSQLGNKWSAIATHLPGRTDNEIKNFWNTHIKKKLLKMGIDPVTHRPRTDHLNVIANLPQLLAAANLSNLLNPLENALMLQLDATQLAKIQILHNLLQVLSTSNSPPPNTLFQDLCNSHQYDQGLQAAGFGPENPIQSNFNYQVAAAGLKMCTAGNNNASINQFGVSCAIPTSNLFSGSVSSASPECCTGINNQVESKKNPNPNDMISNPSSTSTTFEAWGEFMDDEATDSYWKEIIDQETSQPWPIS